MAETIAPPPVPSSRPTGTAPAAEDSIRIPVSGRGLVLAGLFLLGGGGGGAAVSALGGVEKGAVTELSEKLDQLSKKIDQLSAEVRVSDRDAERDRKMLDDHEQRLRKLEELAR